MAAPRAGSRILPGALLAAWFAGVSYVFVEPLLPSAQHLRQPFSPVDSVVAAGAKKRGDKWERKFQGIKPQHKEEEFVRGKGKLEYNEMPEIVLPDDGVKLLHLEYEFSNENIDKMLRLNQALQQRWGAKVRLLNNDVKALQMIRGSEEQLQPPRAGSFEVVDMHTKQPVFSKMVSGVDMFYSQEYLSAWLDSLNPTSEDLVEAAPVKQEQPVEA
mmetsp:Transcript_49508/g.115812  ORF Transcript_49508/g.115812 Transcript_49508/m.115812 type:complete len:215 (+) Transcript_49508:50-694(+)